MYKNITEIAWKGIALALQTSVAMLGLALTALALAGFQK